MNFTEWPNPDGWMDIVAYLIAAIFMLLITIIPLRNGKVIKDIKNQVVNGHTSPLRDDLDRAIKAIGLLGDELSSFRKAMAHDVESLRQQLADEEQRRRSHISELRSDHERRFNSIDDRLER